VAVEGQSLIDGLRRDTERNLFRARNGIKFVTGIGRPRTGLTPKQLIWSREKASMWRYQSDQRTRRTPVLIVFSILGRSYVLDLRPGVSFVQWLLDEGIDVYLVDFGVPDAVDATNTLETYVDRYLPQAVAAALAESATESIDVMGYCFGGVFATLLVAGHPELPISSLAVMATPMDFSGTEGVVQALRRGKLEIDDLVDDTGNVPAETVHRMFRTLKPTSGISTYAMLWERLWNDEFVEAFQAMSQWAADQVPFPGACARQCLDIFLRRNLLATGEVPLGRRTVRLADIECPLLNIYAEHDHIVSPASSLPLNDLVSSQDVTTLPVPAGHIGLAASRQAVRTTIPGVVSWLNTHGD
jgi:polyhydroxyalkanoate synthase subunit PhaC